MVVNTDTNYRKTSWIPGPAPLIAIPTTLQMVGKSIRGETLNFSFNVTGKLIVYYLQANVNRLVTKGFLIIVGPDHIGIMLSPYKGLRLKKWSILDEKPLQGPLWNDRETYFIYYSCLKDCEPLNFSLELNVSSMTKSWRRCCSCSKSV